MALQIRLRHPLGEKMIELEARPADRALVVGRSADADVQVPSTMAAPRHCLLYVEEGRWVVADAGSSQGTCVNGKAIAEPTLLTPGDVVSLGAGVAAPRLEIDPLGAGKAVTPPVDGTATGIGAGAGAFPQPQAPVPAVYPGYTAPGGAYAGGGGPVTATGQEPAGGGEAGEWDWAVQASRRPGFYVPKQRTSGSMMGVGLALALVLVVIGGVVLYRAQQKAAAPPPPAVRIVKLPPTPAKSGLPSPATRPQTRANNIFDRAFQEMETQPTAGKSGPKPKPAGGGGAVGTSSGGSEGDGASPKPVEEAPAPVTVVVEGAAGEGEGAPPPKPRPGASDADWQAVEQAYRYGALPVKIYTFEEYRANHPDSPNLEDVKLWEEEALDQLWWVRIKGLCEKRDELQGRVDKLNQELAGAGGDAAFTKRVTDERDRAESTRQAAATGLAQMGFEGKEIPNLFDVSQLARLRAERSAEKFEPWRAAVIKHVKRTRDSLPWEATR